MQPDLNRCSSLSGDHATGNGSSGSMLEPGMPPIPMQQQQQQQQQPLTPSHPHSFSQFQDEQQQQQLSQQPEAVVTALKPHPQHPKKARVGKDVRKNVGFSFSLFNSLLLRFFFQLVLLALLTFLMLSLTNFKCALKHRVVLITENF